MTEHTGAPMTNVFAAYLCLTSTDTATLDDARSFAAALDILDQNERERRTPPPSPTGSPGSGTPRPVPWTTSSLRWPTDLLALTVGQQLDFCRRRRRSTCATGSAAPSGRSTRTTPTTPSSSACTPSASRSPAPTTPPRTPAWPRSPAHPDDVWAVHAVAHVHEMRGDIDARDPLHDVDHRADWGDGQPLRRAPLVAPGALPARGSGGSPTSSASTTPASTTRRRRASRSRCSTPAPCCGACTSTASTSVTRFDVLADAWTTPDRGRPLVRVQRRPRDHGAGRRRPPRRRPSRGRPPGPLAGRTGPAPVEPHHDRPGRTARRPGRRRPGRGAPRRRGGRAAARPAPAHRLRRLQRPARRAAADPRRLGDPRRPPRPGRRPTAGSPSRPVGELVRTGPAGAARHPLVHPR